MSIIQNLKFIDNKAAKANPDQFICVDVGVDAILKSWQLSVFSYEWMEQDGSIKLAEALKPVEQEKRALVERALQAGEPMERPVLGIGIQDNVEIGSGKALLLTLASHGLQRIPVHIPQSNESDFKAFMVDVS